MHILDIVLTCVIAFSAVAYLAIIVYGLKNIKHLMIRVQLGLMVDDLFTAPKLKLASVTLLASIVICWAVGPMTTLWVLLAVNVVMYALSFYTKRRLEKYSAA